MKKYQLFSEFNDCGFWGNDLPDAILRQKNLPRKGCVINGIYTPSEPVTITKVLGMRKTTGSTRGSHYYVSAVCENSNGQLIEVDAREVDSL